MWCEIRSSPARDAGDKGARIRDHNRKHPRISIHIALPNGGSLDGSCIALIDAIAASGSIERAAPLIGSSHRETLSMVRALNRMFAEKVIDTSCDSAGGAVVTDFGHCLAAFFRIIEYRVSADAVAAMQDLGAACDWEIKLQWPSSGRSSVRLF